MARKFLSVFLLFFSLLGGIGSLGWTIYLKEWFIAIGVVVLCYAAYPKIKGWVKGLLS